MIKILFLICLTIPVFAFAAKKDKIIFAENRIGYGVSFSEQIRINKIGLKNWIEEQLTRTTPEPQGLKELIGELEITKKSLATLLKEYKQDPSNSVEKRKIIQAHDEKLIYETFIRDAARSLYSPNQLHERMTWFWSNHFNVYSQKGDVKKFLSDYAEETMHKNALGNFRDILKASLKSPAMSYYLDNFQNTDPNSIANGKAFKDKIKGINENYAREIMELHTLGQGTGYTQKDVEELARVLTGFSYRKDTTAVKMQLKFQKDAVEDGFFFFDPRRHDFGDKIFLGHKIAGSGYQEIEQVLDILVSDKNTARTISHKLAVFFVSDHPSEKLIGQMSNTFLKTHGNISDVLRIIFQSREFWRQSGKNNKLKLPHEYIYSIIRLGYDQQQITNFAPLWNQMVNMGEQPYGHLTPDGYGIKNEDWASADQMEKRIVFATSFNNKNTNLFNKDDIRQKFNEQIGVSEDLGANKTFKVNTISFSGMYNIMEPVLSKNTKMVLEEAPLREKVGYLLSAPEMVNK